ncbi:MAG: hypothetical protein WBJ10_07935 [Daejeonella sp.]|uniref:hypothetical protein n=1 Tax=Daejeonella sp. TaxID=2805397 RepID=UPI003C794B00
MLFEDFNQNELVEAQKKRVLNLRVSYPVALDNKVNKVLHYAVHKMGFDPQAEFTFNAGDKRIDLRDSDENMLSIHIEASESAANTENIIFYTNDCLRDYHRYLVLGVEFVNRPEYNSAGLQVRFIDDEDNFYTLLEERNYNES